MTKGKMMQILINDGCTKRGAEEHIKLGTTIYTAEDEREIKEAWELTLEEIEAGNGGDIVATTFEGVRYYIAYAN